MTTVLIVDDDINMPNMDGLQLSEIIKALYPICRIIIVTEFRDFEYARRALKIDATNMNVKQKQYSKTVAQALLYIEQNLTDPKLSLKQIAASIYSNESYLSRVFKRETGHSLTEFITKKRISESIKLLGVGDLKIYEIAERVGFRDPHYFSICFKKHIGITIKEYKARGCNQN